MLCVLPHIPFCTPAVAAGATAGRAPSRAGRAGRAAGQRARAGVGHRAAGAAERGLGLRSALGPAGGRAGGWLAAGLENFNMKMRRRPRNPAHLV